MANLTPELASWQQKIEKYASDYKLDFFETIFEIITYDQINQFASYGGFPVRYPHWRFGMEYEQLSKSYEYGLSKIYEMVINTDPCYAYLMEGNRMVDQKLVMAHVYGHCDFFKNNQWFSPTNRKMMDAMANHATRIRRYIDRYGVDVVEDFVDKCLSLENLIDRYSPYIKKRTEKERQEESRAKDQGGLLRVDREYMDEYINPPDFVRFQQQRIREEQERKQKVPSEPQRDVLEFLMHFAPLKNWQQDVLSIIRDEAYYFAPQGMTKIMNEGWASYWHSKIMTEKVMKDSEVIDFADAHSGTMAMAPNGFNPYKVGIELFRDIEDRWNKGRFGKEWNECDDIRTKTSWDLKLGKGREKIFEVRRNYNDVTFIDEFLTEDFCVRNKFFVYKFNKRTGRYEIDTRDFAMIKKQLLFQLTNFGQPIIQVEDANFENRGELLLTHLYEGIEMQPDYMRETLRNLQAIWSRPVNLATVIDNQARLVNFDGKEFKEIVLQSGPAA
ncbi:MAG: SpoVR family protein [Bdellovibrionaceae bacterium]|nr:SpoVR family protein [Pseudobdellovibrionaceae bacterium]